MKTGIFVSSLRGGGAERVASLWSQGFVNQGDEVFFVLGTEYQPSSDYAIPETARTYTVENKGNRISRWWHRFRSVGQIIQAEKPDIIITVIHFMDLAAWWYTRKTKTKLISTEHNAVNRPVGNGYRAKYKYQKFINNHLFDYVTVLTDTDRNLLQGHGFPVGVLPNPLTFTTASRVPQKKKTILSIGRFDIWYAKGFDVLLQAWAQTESRFPDWQLQLLGSGTEGKKYLMNLATSLRIEHRVEFIDYTKDILPIYEQAAIYVLSSRQEGFGMVLLEAMSQGCASIACDYEKRQSGIIEDAGLICPTDDVDALAKSIQRLTEDDQLRTTLQNKAILQSEKFSLDNIMFHWNEIIKQIHEQ